MHQRYKDRVQFLGIYIRETHAADGWSPLAKGQFACEVKQPTNLDERRAIAGRFCQTVKITMPLLVDEMDDRVAHAYSGMPDRLYLIDKHGRVAYKGGRGPFGYRPAEMEQSLIMLLLEENGRQKASPGPARPPSAPKQKRTGP